MLEAELRDSIGDVDLNVSLAVEPGRILAVTGPSGCGKTTLLRAIAGLRRPRSGRVSCSGVDWFDSESGIDLATERRQVGFVFQEYALFPRMSAEANVAFALRGLPRSQRRIEALELLADVGLADRESSRPANLSGGERQRLALARAMASGPSLLLLDEPLAALDGAAAEAALELIGATVAKLAVPCLLVTHSPEVVKAADGVLELAR